MSGSQRHAGTDGSAAPETAAELLSGAPRVAALDALLREVDDLRLTLETDLTLAAAAVESGATGLAGELVDGDLGQLHAFEARALHHLDRLAAGEVVVARRRRRRRVRLATAPLAGAAAALVAVLGLLPGATSAEAPPQTAAMSSWAHLTRLAGTDAPPSQLRVAAMQWHAEVADLVARAALDPAAARQALVLLQAEQEVLSRHDPDAVEAILAQSRALADRLRAALPPVAAAPVRTVVSAIPRVPLPVVVVPTSAPRPQSSRARAATASPSPAPAKASPTASPVPTPEPTASRPAPSASPTPSPEPDALPLEGAKETLNVGQG